jgi:very-short-patch-repair endonuclease
MKLLNFFEVGDMIAEQKEPKYTTDTFKGLASKKHPEYDFSESIYKGLDRPTEVKCKKEDHPNFKTTPKQILGLTGHNWKGCPKCYEEKINEKHVDKIHKLIKYIDKYKLDWDLSNVEIKTDNRNKYIYNVYCNKHKKVLDKWSETRLDATSEENLIIPCPECHKERKKKLFIDKANKIWCKNNTCQFNYNDIELTFENGKNFIKNIRCNIHPTTTFDQRTDSHFNMNNGCPSCQRESESIGETTLEEYFINNNIKYEPQEEFTGCTNQIEGTFCRKLPFDFYLNDENILVEIDGNYHFDESTMGADNFQRRVFLDKLKNDYAKGNAKKIIRIYWNSKSNVDKKKNELIETFNKLLIQTNPSIPGTNIYLSDDYPKKGWNAPDSDQKDIEPINEIILRIKSLMK